MELEWRGRPIAVHAEAIESITPDQADHDSATVLAFLVGERESCLTINLPYPEVLRRWREALGGERTCTARQQRGGSWVFDCGYRRYIYPPADLLSHYTYCPRCGGRVVAVPYEEKEDADA